MRLMTREDRRAVLDTMLIVSAIVFVCMIVGFYRA